MSNTIKTMMKFLMLGAVVGTAYGVRQTVHKTDDSAFKATVKCKTFTITEFGK